MYYETRQSLIDRGLLRSYESYMLLPTDNADRVAYERKLILSGIEPVRNNVVRIVPKPVMVEDDNQTN